MRDAAAGESLFPIPAELPSDVAALAEPLGVGMNAVNRVEARPGDKVAVFGAGPIGLAAIATLRDRGVEDVVAVDLSPRRLEIASALGARATVDASRDDPWQRLRALHGEEPVLGAPMAATDAYVEASGAAPLIPDILQHAKGEARLSCAPRQAYICRRHLGGGRHALSHAHRRASFSRLDFERDAVAHHRRPALSARRLRRW